MHKIHAFNKHQLQAKFIFRELMANFADFLRKKNVHLWGEGGILI